MDCLRATGLGFQRDTGRDNRDWIPRCFGTAMNPENPQESSHIPPPSPPEREETAPTIAAHSLLQGRKEVRISHQGEIYRLRITSRGRLILQK